MAWRLHVSREMRRRARCLRHRGRRVGWVERVGQVERMRRVRRWWTRLATCHLRRSSRRHAQLAFLLTDRCKRARPTLSASPSPPHPSPTPHPPHPSLSPPPHPFPPDGRPPRHFKKGRQRPPRPPPSSPPPRLPHPPLPPLRQAHILPPNAARSRAGDACMLGGGGGLGGLRLVHVMHHGGCTPRPLLDCIGGGRAHWSALA